MTSQSATLTSYYGWHFKAERQKRRKLETFWDSVIFLKVFQKTFMALSLLCRFVFEAKGKTHRGISLIFTRSEAPVGHFSELSWLFLLLSIRVKNLCCRAVFCSLVKGSSQSFGWMATLLEICDIGHDWCVYTLYVHCQNGHKSSSLTATVSSPYSFHFMECQILTQLAVY